MARDGWGWLVARDSEEKRANSEERERAERVRGRRMRVLENGLRTNFP